MMGLILDRKGNIIEHYAIVNHIICYLIDLTFRIHSAKSTDVPDGRNILLLLVLLAPVMSVSDVFDITNVGAKSDGIANNTASFRAAAAAVSAANGGMLLVPLGVYIHREL